MKRIAIVNRGEAASRCIRAIKELRSLEHSDLASIALYTEPDASAPFVRQADHAVSLGPALRSGRDGRSRLAYLDHTRVLAALRATRADTVWPGWGFLAEDPEFVAALEERDILFLGPSSATMRMLGDKIAAKRLASENGIPVAPWSEGPIDAEATDQIESIARCIGFPLLIKASAGGGGRGIRVVRAEPDLASAIASARAEAELAFGDDTLFLEAMVDGPRHIEAQIAADQRGHVMSFGLRDCSVQRRHQKVLEESPPPSLPAKQAMEIEDAAVTLARAAGYRGVGTVEFLLAADGASFYFLEVNPRLQVEHGVTEAVTGCDLVALQIQIGRGDPLPEKPTTRGHAIEVRICAEEAQTGFAPAPGRIDLLDMPSGPGIRNEHSATIGTEIPAQFDSLVAKVIAHADERPRALARLHAALSDLRLMIRGGATNRGFLLNLVNNRDIRSGAVNIHWLDRNLGELIDSRLAAQALVVAAILTYLRERALQRLNFFAEVARGEPRSIPDRAGQSIDLTMRGSSYRLRVLGLGNWRYRVDLDRQSCIAVLLDQEEHACQLALGENRFSVEYGDNASAWQIEVNGHRHSIGGGGDGAIRAAAPSVVVAINVQSGDSVVAGQQIGVLEAMKIEIAVTTPFSGTVGDVRVRIHQKVAAGEILVTVQTDERSTDRQTGEGGNAPVEAPCLRLPETPATTPPTLEVAFSKERFEREKARLSIQDTLRRALLGYDCEESEIAEVETFFDETTPAHLGTGQVDDGILNELTDIRSALKIFADTEILFSRQPNTLTPGTHEESSERSLTRSNDAKLRAYLQHSEAQGADIDEAFLAQLQTALRWYDVDDLIVTEALQRALLRLYTARRHRRSRHRLVEAALRFLGRLIEAGANVPSEPSLIVALGTCIALRGETPDPLADAAMEIRAALLEVPEIERRTRLATETLESALAEIEADSAAKSGTNFVSALACSAPPIFEHVLHESTRRDSMCLLALQAIVLRWYAPVTATNVRTISGTCFALADFSLDNGQRVVAALADEDSFERAWRELCGVCVQNNNAGNVDTIDAAEIIVRSDVASIDAAKRIRQRCLQQARAQAVQTNFTSFAKDGGSFSVGDLGPPDSSEEHGLHRQSHRRIGLDRLRFFALERLPAPTGIYAFFGRSLEQASDERLFVFGEAYATVPGSAGTLHEASFVQAFSDATRTMRRLRAQNPAWQRLHWNRMTIEVRPAFHLTEATLQRLLRELMPTTRHLGLERIVIRLSLLDPNLGVCAGAPASEDSLANGATQEVRQELVIEPATSGHPHIAWRTPHDTAIEPADRYARRLALARHRGLIYPYEAIRTMTSGKNQGNSFVEYDIGDDGKSCDVHTRQPGQNTAAIVFGISTAKTDKYPEGIQRVTILSDPTIGMGALTHRECDRIIAALDLATEKQLPVEWFATSAGARIAMDSGTENLDAVAGVVRRIISFTSDKGGEINIVVCGINVGAQSYFNALCTMMMHSRGILIMIEGASMILTGKRALDASGGTSAEDERAIGGYEDIMGPNGQAQCHARDLDESFAHLMQHYELTYRPADERAPRRFATTDPTTRRFTEEPYLADGISGASIADYVGAETNPGRKMPFAIRPVMRALIDHDSDRMERWSSWRGAETAVVWDTHLGGHAVCMIGIENQPIARDGYAPSDGPTEWTGATLFPRSSKKVARALNGASANRPAVILANLAGFDGSPEAMRELQLEYGAEIATAVVTFVGPIFFVVMSRYHGGAYVVFSTHLNDHLTAMALQGSYASVIGGGPAATVIFGAEVKRRTEQDERVRSLEKELEGATSRFQKAALRSRLNSLRADVHTEHHQAVAAEFDRVHSIERAQEVGSIHEIVSAVDLRQTLISALDRWYTNN